MSELPEPVVTLLREHADSFEKLEVLLLLGGRGDRAWSADEIADELHIERDIAAAVLNDRPDPAALKQLAGLYDQHRLEILSFISAGALKRVGASAARLFAKMRGAGAKKPPKK